MRKLSVSYGKLRKMSHLKLCVHHGHWVPMILQGEYKNSYVLCSLCAKHTHVLFKNGEQQSFMFSEIRFFTLLGIYYETIKYSYNVVMEAQLLLLYLHCKYDWVWQSLFMKGNDYSVMCFLETNIIPFHYIENRCGLFSENDNDMICDKNKYLQSIIQI